MNSSTLDANRQARRVLVQHWVDLGRVSVHTSNNAIYLRGSLSKIAGADSDFNPASLELMFSKLKGIDGIRFVHVELDNWERAGDSGAWREKTTLSSGAARVQFKDAADHGAAYKVE